MLRGEHADVVDEHVHRSEGVLGGGEQRVDALGVGHVALDGGRLDVQVAGRRDDLPGGLVARPVVDDDIRARVGQREHQPATESQRAPGHQRRAPVEVGRDLGGLHGRAWRAGGQELRVSPAPGRSTR